MPDVWTLAGGSLLLLTLIGHEVAGILSSMEEMRLADKAQRLIPASAPAANGVRRQRTNSKEELVLFNLGAHRSPLGERFREAVGSRTNSYDSQREGPSPLIDDADDVYVALEVER